MLILKESENAKKYDKKRYYRQPQIKEIGRVHNVTKGSGVNLFKPDDNWTILDPTQS